MELQYKVQNYDWGKLGHESLVAKLLSSADPEAVIDPNKPYAELWIGTHPNGPSLIIDRGVLLSEYLKDNLDAIGPVVRKQFGVTVPFLLKILSIRKSLSIQAHPTKEHAEELHRKFPDIYKDPNHKPELAVALTPFEALCGFRPIADIKNYLSKLPELTQILSAESVESLNNVEEQGDGSAALRLVFHSLMTSDKAAVATGLQNLLARLEKEDASTQEYLQYSLVGRLWREWPGDAGCWAPYLLHHLRLSPGDALYLRPNMLHAYLSGDCVECMSTSDNVVRAGLTPKPVDVPTLLHMLDYVSQPAAELTLPVAVLDRCSRVWRPPCPDFALVHIYVASGDSYNTGIRGGPSVLLFVGGAGSAADTEPARAEPGRALFLKASRQLTLTPDHGSYIEAYQAVVNV